MKKDNSIDKPSQNSSKTNADPKRRLWVVTELYYPEETSTGYHMTRIAEGLSNDLDVKALCGQPNYSLRGVRAPKHEFHNGVEIFRAAATTLNKDVIAFRLINMITLSITVFFKAIFRFNAGDRVLVVTTPPTLPFVVAIASLLRGAQYTLLIHDIYPEILFAVGKSKESSMLATTMNFFNRWLYKHASTIIAIGRDMKALLEAKTAGLDSSIAVIQNWAELETVHPEPREKNTLLDGLGLMDKFVLLYAGNMGHSHDIETIVEAAKMLNDREEIHFIFLGSGAKEPWLKREVTQEKMKNVTLLSPQPRSEQVTFLNACDVSIVSLAKKMWGVSMPSRTYNILAAGKPILALTDPDSELSIVIDEDRIGWHAEAGNPVDLVKAIISIYENRESLGERGQRARTSAMEKYSLETAISKYRSVLSA